MWRVMLVGIAGSGVSALALDWLSGASAPQFSLRVPRWRQATLSADGLGVMLSHTYVVPIRSPSHRWHHSSGGGADGLGQQGPTSPAIDLSNIDSLPARRWRHPEVDGALGKATTPAEFADTLRPEGRATLAEALAEPPQRDRHDCTRSVLHRQNTNLGPPTATEVTSRLTSTTRVRRDAAARAGDDPTQHPGRAATAPAPGSAARRFDGLGGTVRGTTRAGPRPRRPRDDAAA